MIVLSVPIVAFLYQRGEFTPETTRMVAWALVWYTTGLVFHSIYEVLVRAYYSMHDTKTPVIVGAAAMTLSIILSLLFSSLFSTLGWLSHGGLALAVSVSTALEVTTLLFIMRKRLQGLEGTGILKALKSASIGTLVMVAVLLLWVRFIPKSPDIFVALGGVTLGLVSYGLMLLILRVPEVKTLLAKILNKLHRA